MLGKQIGVFQFRWLAIGDPEPVSEARIGILMTSLVAGIRGFLVLTKALPKKVTQ